MPATLSLNCYVLGDTIKDCFKVKIASTEDVSDLKEAFTAKISPLSLQNFVAKDLHLWATPMLTLNRTSEGSTWSITRLCYRWTGYQQSFRVPTSLHTST